jgi:hypothetical protein
VTPNCEADVATKGVVNVVGKGCALAEGDGKKVVENVLVLDRVGKVAEENCVADVAARKDVEAVNGSVLTCVPPDPSVHICPFGQHR